MSRYFKMSYRTLGENKELRDCIMYIGEYYGKNNDDSFKAGVNYLAKKVKGASKRSVRFMVYPKKIRNSQMDSWWFKKNSYSRVYDYIIFKMVYVLKKEKDINEKKKIIKLLSDLYQRVLLKDPRISKSFCGILVNKQNDMLRSATNRKEYEKEIQVIDGLIEGYESCGRRYDSYLSDL